MHIGETLQWRAQRHFSVPIPGSPDGYVADVKWEVVDQSILDVRPRCSHEFCGYADFTGRQPGTTTVLATDGSGLKQSAVVTVLGTDAVPSELRITDSNGNSAGNVLAPGYSRPLFARAVWPGRVQDVTSEVIWVSQNAAVATVTSAGLLLATGPGRATITARYRGQNGNHELEVLDPSVDRVRIGNAGLSPGQDELRARVNVVLASSPSGELRVDFRDQRGLLISQTLPEVLPSRTVRVGYIQSTWPTRVVVPADVATICAIAHLRPTGGTQLASDPFCVSRDTLAW